MEKLYYLYKYFSERLDLKITYNAIHENYTLNGAWVTDINSEFFEGMRKSFISLIDENINRENLDEVRFLRTIQNRLKESLCSLNEFNYKEMNSFVTSIDAKFSEPAPKLEPMDLDEPTPWESDGREEFIQDFLLMFLGIDMKPDGVELGDKEEEWFESLEEINKRLEKLSMFQSLEEAYARAHLWLVLSFQKEIISEIVSYIDTYFFLMSEMGKNIFEEEQENSENVSSNPLYLNLSKEEVAILFNNLFDFGYIHSEKRGNYLKTPLKKFLSNGNVYFLDKLNRKPINKINQEFGKIFSGDLESNIESKEIEFLKNMKENIEKRLAVLGV